MMKSSGTSSRRAARLAAVLLLAMLALACQAAPSGEQGSAVPENAGQAGSDAGAAPPAGTSPEATPSAREKKKYESRMPPAETDLGRITAEQAREHIGDRVTVCGRVARAVWAQDQPRKPTYLSFGRPYPNQVFSVVIRDEDRGKFSGPPEDLYDGKDVCVTGTVTESDAGGPTMRLDDPARIVIAPGA